MVRRELQIGSHITAEPKGELIGQSPLSNGRAAGGILRPIEITNEISQYWIGAARKEEK
jgi:hypothetical protein